MGLRPSLGAQASHSGRRLRLVGAETPVAPGGDSGVLGPETPVLEVEGGLSACSPAVLRQGSRGLRRWCSRALPRGPETPVGRAGDSGAPGRRLRFGEAETPAFQLQHLSPSSSASLLELSIRVGVLGLRT